MFVWFFALIFTSFSLSAEPFHLCYFSLSQRSQDIGKPFKDVKGDIKIIEYYSSGKGIFPSTKFREMAQSKERCDGLVISGHHTGVWYGDKIEDGSDLPLGFMERMSCLYPDFFKNVKALWLHGCNTVTDQYLSPFKEKKASFMSKTADGSTTRLIEKVGVGRTSSVRRLSYSYSHVLDEHTPLSSRYLRIFPNTQIYGFSNAAPSEEQMKKSGLNDIFDHIATLGKMIQQQEEPDKEEELKDRVKRGLEAFVIEDYCTENKIEAWEQHNKDTHRLAIENQDYELARKLGCDLMNAKKALLETSSSAQKRSIKQQIAKVLKTIDEEGLNSLLFHNIFETYKVAKREHELLILQGKTSPFFKQTKDILSSETFKKALTEKIDSSLSSSLRRIDYLKFYEELHGRDAFFEKARKAHIDNIKKLYPDLKNSRVYSIHGRVQGFNKKSRGVFATVVAEQLRQYNFLTQEDIESLTKNKSLFPKKNSSFRNIKYKMKYNSYLLSDRKSSFIEKIKEDVKSQPDLVTVITEEALRNKDIQTVTEVFSQLDKSFSGEEFRTLETSLRQGMINHLQFDNYQDEALRSYMKSTDNFRLKQSFLVSAYDLRKKDFLKQFSEDKKQDETLRGNAQTLIELLNSKTK